MVFRAVWWNNIKRCLRRIFVAQTLLDFSNFWKDSKFYDSENKMSVGKMKDEYKRILINKFVGLKSKMHSMLTDDFKESNTAKEINTKYCDWV